MGILNLKKQGIKQENSNFRSMYLKKIPVRKDDKIF